jgi:peptidoglycan/LPS O-acetylase OafA/YrhL
VESETATIDRMKHVRELTAGRLLVVGAAALLLVDTFLPWQRLSIGAFSYHWNAWHGDKGVLLGALVAVLLGWSLVRSLGVAMPARLPQASVTLGLAALVLAVAAVKNIHDDDSAWGSYLGVVLAAVAVAGAWQGYRRDAAALSVAESRRSPTRRDGPVSPLR